MIRFLFLSLDLNLNLLESWGTFSTSCLIGVAYAASSYQLQKLQPRLRLTAEGA